MIRVSSWQRVMRTEAAHTLVMFCVDGRYARYMDEFMESNLRLEGADWLAVPGGPAALIGRAAAEGDSEYLWRELDFLVSAHEITRIILVFHEDCGHYHRLMGDESTEDERRDVQHEDAHLALAALAERFPQASREAYWQYADDTAVCFDEIPQIRASEP